MKSGIGLVNSRKYYLYNEFTSTQTHYRNMDKLSRPYQDYSVDGNLNTSISLNKGKWTYTTFKMNGPHVFRCAIFQNHVYLLNMIII